MSLLIMYDLPPIILPTAPVAYVIGRIWVLSFLEETLPNTPYITVPVTQSGNWALAVCICNGTTPIIINAATFSCRIGFFIRSFISLGILRIKDLVFIKQGLV